MTQTVVAALYKLTPLSNLPALKMQLQQACSDAGLCGTLILAPEGINGTVAGTRAGIDTVIDSVRAIPGCGDLNTKDSFAAEPPFYRMKVRLKREVITMGVPSLDANALAGTYVEPETWNALIADSDVVLIDTRNRYEVEIGSFPGAINPQTTSFREFPDWFDRQTELHDKRKFAMFCTGGIRCEKATAFLRMRGFDAVYHLKGGILNYLESVPAAESRWRGECFVFDQRTALAHGNAPGSHEICHACRHPVSPSDKASKDYAAGVSCPRCKGTHSLERERRFAERQKQVEIAELRGKRHFGPIPLKDR